MTSSPALPDLASLELSTSTPASSSSSSTTTTTINKPSKSARGRPTDSDETRYSKTLSYILRHGAAKESLVLREDGFVRVEQLLKRPKLKGLDFPALALIVASNEKQRFTLREEEVAVAVAGEEGTGEMEWWIRANQGHSVIVEKLELRRIEKVDEVPVVVHGTYLKNWEAIEREGLKVMTRNHLHCAIGLVGEQGVISGMRSSCDLFIYLNVALLFKDGIELFRSTNDVILTAGISGVLAPKYFEKVITKSGEILVASS